MNGNGRIPQLPNSVRIGKAENALKQLIDMQLAMHALMMEKGLYIQEEFDRMHRVSQEGRSRLSKAGFGIEEGLAAIRASYRIELRGARLEDKSGPEKA